MHEFLVNRVLDFLPKTGVWALIQLFIFAVLGELKCTGTRPFYNQKWNN